MKTPYYHLSLNITTTEAVLDHAASQLTNDESALETIYFLNAHCFNMSLNSAEYKKSLDDATWLLNDGIGIKIGATLQGAEILENMNGTDLIPKLLGASANANAKAFLLGAQPGVADKAAQNFCSSISGLEIAGVQSGFFDSDQEVVDRINQSEAKVLVVGMGVPKQEIWIEQNKAKFTHLKIAVAGGAILDFTAGEVVRAPQIVQKLGLEWLFRLCQEPRRLFRRYVIGNFTFLFHVFRHRSR